MESLPANTGKLLAGVSHTVPFSKSDGNELMGECVSEEHLKIHE